MNILMCSAGRRCELLKRFRKTLGEHGKIVATDISPYAPALWFADQQYLVPKITDADYISVLADICEKEKIDAVFTLIDPEIAVLAKHRSVFEQMGVKVFVPSYTSAELCFDKYALYRHMQKHGVPMVRTYGALAEFTEELKSGKIGFPVFVKPRTGSGSVGARKIDSLAALQTAMADDPMLIIQEYMNCDDLDADVYVDAVSGAVVSIFSKKKISTTIGGANKTVSFKDEKLFDLIVRIADVMELYGPNDMDFFYRDGQYYLSEINPRFGGAYLHAYDAGVDFIELVRNNVHHAANLPRFGHYEEDVVMMMYDSVVVKKREELLNAECFPHRQ